MNKTFARLFLSCFFCLLLPAANGQPWSFSQKVVAIDRLIGQEVFGQFVALNEDYAIISAWADDFDANGQNNIDDAGAVYLYQKSETGVWTFLKKIVASDRTLYDGFGYGLAVDGNYAVIGAPFEGHGFVESAGAFYVFENKNGNFTEKQKLFAPDREYLDEFGWKIDISGDWIIAGSLRDGEDENGENTIGGAGSAYLYHRDGNKWAVTQKILASDRGEEGDSFGGGVAIFGDYAAIAATRNKDSGSVYIFKNGGGVWTEVQKLRVKTDRGGFGRGLAMKENRLVVGSGGEFNSNGNEATGAAYIFENIDGVWTEIQRIEASDGRFLDGFGFHIDLEGDNIVVGASVNNYDENGQNFSVSETGAAYIYQKNTEGVWTEVQKIVAPDRSITDWLDQYHYPQYFGIGVGISGGDILCGANVESYDENGHNYIKESGAAYFFQNPVLPLGFSALTGEKKNNKNILYWQTYTETNLQNMQVQRSTDGVNFQAIATLAAHQKPSTYSYEDATAVAGVTNFYRISFAEQDGRKELSNTISIAATAIPFTISIRPNPFTVKLSVVVNTGLKESSPMHVHWYNTAGRLVYTETRFVPGGDHTLTLNTAAIPKGIYITEFVLSDGRRKVEKLVKE